MLLVACSAKQKVALTNRFLSRCFQPCCHSLSCLVWFLEQRKMTSVGKRNALCVRNSFRKVLLCRSGTESVAVTREDERGAVNSAEAWTEVFAANGEFRLLSEKLQVLMTRPCSPTV